jgi:glutamate carboxypeptidase
VPPQLVSDAELTALDAAVAAALPAYLEDLARLVDVDCGSYTKVGVDTVGRWVQEAFAATGATVSLERDERLGDTVVGSWQGRAGGPRALLVGHLDTVFDPGTAAQRPFRTVGGRAMGPGVSDMKAGLLAGIYALRAVDAVLPGGLVGGLPYERLTFVANPDEEIGSPVSSAVIRRIAGQTDVCFVLECARANGDIVSARKGIVDLRIRVRGRAAHAGVEPEKGRSAVLAAAHLTVALHALNGRWPGVTVNVGVLHAGTRPNVVAEEAELQVDLRAPRRTDLEDAEAEIRRLCDQPVVPDVTCELLETARHWPMERSASTVRLADRARELAGRLGFDLRDTATGGASDANTTAGLGVPTLDGLGPIGGADHSPDEYLELDSIVPRTTLLAALLLAVGRDPELPRRP